MLANPPVRRLLILTHDLIMITSAFPISIVLRENFDPKPYHLQPAIYGTLILLVITFVILRIMSVQQTMWRYSSPSDLLKVAKALSVITTVFFATMFLLDRLEAVPRSVPVIFWLVALAGLCSTRIIYSSAVVSYARHHHKSRQKTPYRLLVMANLETSAAIIKTLNCYQERYLKVVGIVAEHGERGRTLNGTEVLGESRQLSQILASLDVAGCYPHAIVVGDVAKDNPTHQLPQLQQSAIDLPFLRSADIDKLPEIVSSDAFLAPLTFPAVRDQNYANVKRFIDIAASLVALFLLLPLLTLVALATWFQDGSPVFFTQIRTGKNLREFNLIKFRTMRPLFDKSGRQLGEGERVTRLGTALRTLRVDELPQLWNVFWGDMSLIGPRPLLRRDMPTESSILSERYSLRPGITGWAQVNGGTQIENDMKMPLDIFYVRNFSFLFDMTIIFLTVRTIFFGEKIGHNAINKAKNVALNNQT